MSDQYEEMEARELAADAERDRQKRDLELLAKIRAPGRPLDAFLDLMEEKRVSCEAEVKYCESRCEDDVVAVARRCLELVEQVTQLLRGDQGGRDE